MVPQLPDTPETGSWSFHQLWPYKHGSLTSPSKLSLSPSPPSPPAPKIQLELSKTTGYLPGQTICGSVELDNVHPDSGVSIHSVKIVLVGRIGIQGDKAGTYYESGVLEYIKDDVILEVGLRLHNTAMGPAIRSGFVGEMDRWIKFAGRQEEDPDAQDHAPSQNPNNALRSDEYPMSRRPQRLSLPTMVPPRHSRRPRSVGPSSPIYLPSSPLTEQPVPEEDSPADPSPSSSSPSTPSAPSAPSAPSLLSSFHIPFCLPIPQTQNLPGSHDHKNFPITYIVTARLIYTTPLSAHRERTSSSLPIYLIPFLPVNSFQNSIPHITPSLRTNVRPGLLRRTFLQDPVRGGYIEHSVFVPRRAFMPGESVALRLHLDVLSRMCISRVRVDFSLKSRLMMTCGLGECLEEAEAASGGEWFVLSETNEINALPSRELYLDLSPSTIVIPETAGYTITSVSTGQTFEFVYEMEVNVRVFEKLPDSKHREVSLKKMCFPVVVGSCEIVEEERKVAIRVCKRDNVGNDDGDGSNLPAYDTGTTPAPT